MAVRTGVVFPVADHRTARIGAQYGLWASLLLHDGVSVAGDGSTDRDGGTVERTFRVNGHSYWRAFHVSPWRDRRCIRGHWRDRSRSCRGDLQLRRFRRGGCVLSRTCPPVDLLDEVSLDRAAAYASGKGDIRLVFDATRFLHDDRQAPEKSLREIEPDKLARSFALNAIGPALIMKHVLPRLLRMGKSVFATLSARVGSIGDNRLGGWYSYSASKAALTQLVRTAAIELARRSLDAICVAVHPGPVATALSAPFAAVGLEVQQPAAAARHLLAVVDRLYKDDNGGFFDWQGLPIPPIPW